MQPKFLIAMSVLITAPLSAVIASVLAYNVSRRIAASHSFTIPTRIRELNIVDEHGRVCMTLSASDQIPAVDLLDSSGEKRITMSVDKRGYGAVRLSNPNLSGPVVSVEIDDKGAHVKFDRPGGAASYLFLNNSGGSGVVLIDSKGLRRLDMMVDPSGETKFRRYDKSSSATP